jgi:hypothetical protein
VAHRCQVAGLLAVVVHGRRRVGRRLLVAVAVGRAEFALAELTGQGAEPLLASPQPVFRVRPASSIRCIALVVSSESMSMPSMPAPLPTPGERRDIESVGGNRGDSGTGRPAVDSGQSHL